MARIRTIKPEFWTDEDLSSLPPETHMLAAALLNHADDEGYFKANPRLVQATCCPLRDDSTNIRRSIEMLSSVGYLKVGKGADGKEYGWIVNFTKHQRVDRPKPSKIKELSISWEGSTKDRRRIDEGSTPEQGTGNREQGTGKEDPNGSLSTKPDSSTSDHGMPACPHQKIIDLYHHILPELPRVRLDMWPGGPSEAALRARWRESERRQSIEWWEKLFTRIRQMDLLMGRGPPKPDTGRVWNADLHWIVKRTNFTKILEGKYLDRSKRNDRPVDAATQH